MDHQMDMEVLEREETVGMYIILLTLSYAEVNEARIVLTTIRDSLTSINRMNKLSDKSSDKHVMCMRLRSDGLLPVYKTQPNHLMNQ
jgi:hypothetical protein